MGWQKLRTFLNQRFNSYPPFVKAFAALGLLMITLYSASQIFGWVNSDTESFYKEDCAETDYITLLKESLIAAPLKEELKYRGPAWLLLMTLLGLAKWAKKRGNSQPWPEKTLISLRGWQIKVFHILVWPVIVWPTLIWALRHPYPLPVLACGLIFGWLLIRTRSLIQIILLHMLINAFLVVPPL